MLAKAINIVNAGAALAVLAASVLITLPTRPSQKLGKRAQTPSGSRASQVAATEAGAEKQLRDASGLEVPLQRFARIAGGSLVADRLLLMLCEPSRIVAFSSSAPTAYQAYRFSGKPSLPQLTNTEAILAQNLDLLIVNSLSQQPHLQKLREAGVVVFDLGSMHGIETLLPNIDAVGVLLGEVERAQALKRDFVLRMQQMSAHIQPQTRRTAIYVGVHGDKMYGGTVGSSFHDLLQIAGLRDAAAKAFVGWPRYTNEQILTLDPQVIVTQQGMRENLCNHPGLSKLSACAAPAAIVELEPALLLDPGLALVEAAALVQHRVYGPQRESALDKAGADL